MNTTNNDNNNYYSIIKFLKIIMDFNENSEVLIREMNNGDIIMGGPDGKFYIFDKNMEKSVEIDSLKDIETNTNYLVTEVMSSYKNNKNIKLIKSAKNIIETNKSKIQNKEDFIQIIYCSKDLVSLYTIDSLFTNERKKTKNILEISYSGCFDIKNERNQIEYINIGEKGIKHYNHFTEFPSISDKPTFEDESLPFKGGIKISNKYLALTSNSMISNGDDILVFYDIKNKKIFRPQKEIKYSFNTGVNGLLLMKLEDNKEILLCACKKYTSSQKNGILLIEPVIRKNKDIYSCFQETKDFEVNCFCPLTKKENNEILNTNYFFVGGYDTLKRKGLIKLYKINIKNNKSNESNVFSCEIKFLQDIIIEKTKDFDGFKGTVNCIIQTKTKRDLLVSCWDGKVYSFSEPNITYYLKGNVSFAE